MIISSFLPYLHHCHVCFFTTSPHLFQFCFLPHIQFNVALLVFFSSLTYFSFVVPVWDWRRLCKIAAHHGIEHNVAVFLLLDVDGTLTIVTILRLYRQWKRNPLRRLPALCATWSQGFDDICSWAVISRAQARHEMTFQGPPTRYASTVRSLSRLSCVHTLEEFLRQSSDDLNAWAEGSLQEPADRKIQHSSDPHSIQRRCCTTHISLSFRSERRQKAGYLVGFQPDHRCLASTL